MQTEVLRALHIEKDIADLRTLRDVHLNLYAGECHGVLIHNDLARKTLVDILTGLDTPDDGILFIQDAPVRLQSPAQAQALGIYSIRGQSQLTPNTSIAENLFLTNGDYYNHGFMNKKLMRAMAEGLLADAQLHHLSPDMPVHSLKPADAHLVELLKLLALFPKVLILDNIFQSYTQREYDSLAHLLAKRRPDCAVFFFSNRHNTLFSIAHRVTVFRKSSTAITLAQNRPIPFETLLVYQTAKGADTKVEAFAQHMPSTQCVMRAEGLVLPGQAQEQAQSFSLYEREILGFADEEGRYYRDYVGMITGEKEYAGRLTILDRPVRTENLRQSRRSGLSLINVPGVQAIFHNLSLAENITLTMHGPVYNRLGLSNARVKDFAARDALSALNAESIWTQYSQEKYLPHLPRSHEFVIQLARCLCNQTPILCLVNPHLYFDDLSIRNLQPLLSNARERLGGIVIFSIHRDALEPLCDRLIVLS